MIHNLNVLDNKCTFTMKSKDLMVANAIRRALLQDVETIAAQTVKFFTNTSCQTDEYIAHRIGMIPFLCDDNLDLTTEKLELKVSGRTATTQDLIGNFRTIYNIEIMKLNKIKILHIEVCFEKGSGETHARFSPVSGVGYEIKDDKVLLSFESINGEDPIVHLQKAISKIQRLCNVKDQVIVNGQIV